MKGWFSSVSRHPSETQKIAAHLTIDTWDILLSTKNQHVTKITFMDTAMGDAYTIKLMLEPKGFLWPLETRQQKQTLLTNFSKKAASFSASLILLIARTATAQNPPLRMRGPGRRHQRIQASERLSERRLGSSFFPSNPSLQTALHLFMQRPVYFFSFLNHRT